MTAAAIDAQGSATVVGSTTSADFPVTPGAFQTTYHGGGYHGDAFVAHFAADGMSLVYGTFLGGMYSEQALGVAVDGGGEATVVGATRSPDFPTTPGAFDTTYHGGAPAWSAGDGFVTKLDPAGTSLVYSTFFGGSAGESVFAVAISRQGEPTIVGTTASSSSPTGFPVTPGAFSTSYNGGSQDAFVARLTANGANLVYSTFLGGTGIDEGSALVLDAVDGVIVAGWTNGGFPTTPGAFGTYYFGGVWGDAYVARLSPDAARLDYATYLGGADSDGATAIAVDADGVATVVGFTSSWNFPATPGVFNPTYTATTDAFITRLALLPTGVSSFGAPSPGCNGVLPASVTAMPRVGTTTFALTCGNAAPNAAGLVAFAGARLTSPIPVLGVDIWLDPTALVASAAWTSNAIGASEVPLPIPAISSLVGLRFYTQFVWLGPSSPAPCPTQGFSTSFGLDITIQP